jgi:hypothetical protein
MRAQIIPFGAAATVTGTVCHDIPNNRAGLRLPISVADDAL